MTGILPSGELPASLHRMSAIMRNTDLDDPLVWQARVDLAACFRQAARLGLHEGVCNHLSFMVPGRDDLFLVNPDGWSFSEITASRLLICDFHRRVVAGDGVPEDTAFYIHARLHARLPRARAAFHTHMPNATALSMTEGEPLIWAGQSSLKFYGRTVVDEAYNGLALDESEGDRIAAAVGEADIVFMKHHGVLVLAGSIAKAWDDLYYLERACEVQRLAQSTGVVVVPVPKPIAEATAAQMRHEGGRDSPRLHLDSIKRRLDQDAPEYRQ
jgi:ribulose-5-phosphate 4-epimerase/fuculose-1-phosphate aldolase